MSKLEQLAGPPLRGLIEGTRDIGSLSAAERFAVSRWLIKTAATLNLSSGFERLFSADLLYRIAARPLDIPEGFHIFGAQRGPDKPCDWLQASRVPFFIPRELLPSLEDRDRLSADGFVIGFLIKCACLVVAFWPHREWPIASWASIHEPIWPPDANPYRIEHQYPGEDNPLEIEPRLFLYRAVSNLGAINTSVEGPVRLAKLKNRHTYVSGREPEGNRELLPIPDVITPDVEREIKEWQASKRRR